MYVVPFAHLNTRIQNTRRVRELKSLYNNASALAALAS